MQLGTSYYLAAINVPAELLCLEITESGVMRDAARAIEMLKRVDAVGVGCSIDDFGTGYSSLSQLRQLPIASGIDSVR